MKKELLPKPVHRPVPPCVQQVMTVVDTHHHDPRLPLKPYFNQQVLVQATVGTNTYHEHRSFCLLTNVKVAHLDERFKPVDDRVYVSVHHSWIEQTDLSTHSTPGQTIYFPAVVISYQRGDGSWSYGFRQINCTGAGDILAHHCAKLVLALHEKTTKGSPLAALELTLVNIVKELQAGVDLENGLPILYSQYGRTSFIRFLQKNFRNITRAFKRRDAADLKNAWDWLVEVACSSYETSTIPNPLYKK